MSDTETQEIELDNGRAGFIHLKTGKKKFKFTWVALSGSSLYAYKNANDVSPKTVYQLQGGKVTKSSGGDHDFEFTISKDDKLIVSLAGSSDANRNDWVASFERSVTMEAADPPSKEKLTKKGGAAFRLKKAAAGKLAITGAGKKAMKTAINEESKLLIEALKHIVAKVHDQKKADEIEEHLIKIVLKCFFLERDGIITMDDFLRADRPLREAFELLIQMRDFRHRMTPDRVNESLHQVHLHIKQVESIITELLSKHLKANTLKRVAITFGLLGSTEFLAAGWSDETLEEERDMLSDAMNRYTAFHFN